MHLFVRSLSENEKFFFSFLRKESIKKKTKRIPSPSLETRGKVEIRNRSDAVYKLKLINDKKQGTKFNLYFYDETIFIHNKKFPFN